MKFRTSGLCCLSGLLVAAGALADLEDGYAFSKYVPITISHSGTTVSNFPVLVKIDATKIPSFYEDVRNNGADLRFTSEDKRTEYPYDIDTWDPQGTSLVWVKVPALEQGARMRLYYGCEAKTSDLTYPDVWSAYDGVWHLNEDLKDSAGPHDLIARNTAGADVGCVGSGHVVSDSTDTTAKAGALLAKESAEMPLTGNLSVSMWVKHGSAFAAETLVAKTESLWADKYGKTPNGFVVQNCTEWSGKKLTLSNGHSNRGLNTYVTDNQVNWGDSDWHLMTLAWETGETHSTVKIYVDGTYAISYTGSDVTLSPSTQPLVFGNLSNRTDTDLIGSADGTGISWKGSFDELRIGSFTESDDWVKAEYEMVTGDVCTMGTPVDLSSLQVSVLSVVKSASVGESVEFKAVVDGASGALSYVWDFDGDGTPDAEGSSPDASYQYGRRGHFRPTLSVTDSAGRQASCVCEYEVQIRGILYVDTSAAAGGDGSETAPLNSLQAAIAELTPEEAILARGEVLVSMGSEALVLREELSGASILPWGDGRLRIEVASNYAANASGEAVLSVAAAGVTLKGLDFVYHTNSLYDNAVKTVAHRLVDVLADGVTFDDCSFNIPDTSKPGWGNVDSAVFCKKNANFFRCKFDDVRGFRPDTHIDPLAVGNGAKVVECLFTNCWGVARYSGSGRYGDFTFVSNRYYTAVYGGDSWSAPGVRRAGVFRSGSDGVGGGEIAYNIFVDTTGQQALLSRWRYDGFIFETRFHHNTVLGFKCLYCSGFGETSASYMHNSDIKFTDNIIDTDTVLFENAANEGYQVTTFSTKAVFKNNACHSPAGFVTGAAAEAETYDLADYLQMADNIVLENAPAFRSTDPSSPEYLRLKGSKEDWVWQGVDGYPDYVGAIKPVLGQGMWVIIR